MKFLGVVVLVICFAFVASEKCSGTDISTCIHTKCDSSTVLQCVNGLCSCEANLKCISKQDCIDLGSLWNCPNDRRHCVDNMCRCF